MSTRYTKGGWLEKADVTRSAKTEQIADNAAREYEDQTRNPYFRFRPSELHAVLVRIILGAHELIKRADSEAQYSQNDPSSPKESA